MTPDLKTLRSVCEAATPGPWVAGTVPRPHAWDRAFVRIVTDLPDGGRLTAYPAACESTTLDNAANAAFIAAANPSAVLSLLDRVETLEERDDLAMQIISENAKLRREAEAMAETVRTLEAERDRLREAAQFVTDAVTTLRQFKREYPMDIDSQSCAEEAIWLALASLAAALNPSTSVGEAG